MRTPKGSITSASETDTKPYADSVYVGIDPSFSGTGLVAVDTSGKVIDSKLLSSDKSDGEDRRMDSIAEDVVGFVLAIAQAEESLFTRSRVKLVAIEGLAYGMGHMAASHQLAGLHYLVRNRLYAWNSMVIVPPTQLKKFITGKGNSKKDLMLLETYKRFGESFDDDNLCDAFGLAMFACIGCGNETSAKLTEDQKNVAINATSPCLP